MMNKQQAHIIAIAEPFKPRNNIIVIGITVFFAADFTDFLQRVYDNQLCIGMLTDKIFKLFIQSVI